MGIVILALPRSLNHAAMSPSLWDWDDTSSTRLRYAAAVFKRSINESRDCTSPIVLLSSSIVPSHADSFSASIHPITAPTELLSSLL